MKSSAWRWLRWTWLTFSPCTPTRTSAAWLHSLDSCSSEVCPSSEDTLSANVLSSPSPAVPPTEVNTPLGNLWALSFVYFSPFYLMIWATYQQWSDLGLSITLFLWKSTDTPHFQWLLIFCVMVLLVQGNEQTFWAVGHKWLTETFWKRRC